MKKAAKLAAGSAFTFVLVLGIVNLFADTTYEGASSINGPFLKTLGATAAATGIIAGAGEFLGYALRFPAGHIGDRTGKYWVITFIGYAINLLAVPALALAGSWQLAGVFMILERVGRALRKPPVEAMLSYTTNELGKGKVYSINNALDQAGATIGPLLMALVLFLKGDYRIAYALLLITAVLALITLVIARRSFSNPTHLEQGSAEKSGSRFRTSYWFFMLAGAFVAAGLISFELISYHFTKTNVVSKNLVPIFFSIGMTANALSGLVMGRLYDRIGIWAVVGAFFLSSLFAPFVFFGSFFVALGGILLWGIDFGVQDTLLKAIIAGEMPQGKRNRAFGLFYTAYGTAGCWAASRPACCMTISGWPWLSFQWPYS